jgi:hypothetical protein
VEQLYNQLELLVEIMTSTQLQVQPDLNVLLKLVLNTWISRLANLHRNFVITSLRVMASFPAQTTPFFLQIERARGSSMQGIPRALNDTADQLSAPSLPFCYSVAQ